MLLSNAVIKNCKQITVFETMEAKCLLCEEGRKRYSNKLIGAYMCTYIIQCTLTICNK